MYGDFLVPTNTNVNNAITTNTGAKWEKFYEFTFEDSHNEAFEFPHDLDGTPLNLNGVRVVSTYPNGTTITDKELKLYVNGEQVCEYVDSSATVSGGTIYSAINVTIKNGLLVTDFHERTAKTTRRNLQSCYDFMFTDIIRSFTFSIPSNRTFNAGETITFYVLRGV